MLPTPYQEFIYKRTYSRWLPELQRREEWDETVSRYEDFFFSKFEDKLNVKQYTDFVTAIRAVRNLEVMPSMRALWTAGTALEFDNICGYNCAYTEIDSLRAFAEVLYILMNGAGVGASVERQVIAKLPEVPKHIAYSNTTIVFEDSKYGWADGFLTFLQELFNGVCRAVDLSLIRPKGERLRTFGGRASGPEPLQDLINFTLKTVKRAEGRRLNSEECADILCKVAEVVVVGGVRRSAILLLTNPSDRRMQNFKNGEFWLTNPQRQYANVSSCYTEKPSPIQFMEDFIAMMKSGAGERGFVNRESLQRSRGEDAAFGLNPCGEVILRNKQFCNLTEVVVRPEDNLSTLKQKIRSATILGTMQATLSDFRFLSSEWKENTERDRLLGVSLTGIMDNVYLRYCHDDVQEMLQECASTTNTQWADILGINDSASITCIKPSGTVSQLVNCSSGIHPRFAPYFIRRVRVASTDPLCKLLQDSGVPWKPEVGEEADRCKTAVFEFPMKAPNMSVTKDAVSALEQLDTWLMFKEGYTTHNPSVTVYVKEDEWVDVCAWLYDNWDIAGGITFLPYDNGVYQLAPYEEISAAKFTELSNSFPEIDFSKLKQYESDDFTQGSREFACAGGSCEL